MFSLSSQVIAFFSATSARACQDLVGFSFAFTQESTWWAHKMHQSSIEEGDFFYKGQKSLDVLFNQL
jgi:hypothetical protein